MRLSILYAGMFAVLSLAAPAWAETSSSAEPGANCDVANAPDYLFTTPSANLSTVAPEIDPDVEGDIFAGMSESDVYQVYFKACYAHYVYAARVAAKLDSAYPQERFVDAYVGNILALTSRQPIAPGSAWDMLLKTVVVLGAGGFEARYPWLSGLRDRFDSIYKTGDLKALHELAQNYQNAAGFADSEGAWDEASVMEACIGADPKKQSQSLRDYAAERVMSEYNVGARYNNPIEVALRANNLPDKVIGIENLGYDTAIDHLTAGDIIRYYDKNGAYSVVARDLSRQKLYGMAENCSAALNAFVGDLKADGVSDDEVDAKIASLFRDMLKSYGENGKSRDIVLKAMYGNMLHVVASRAQGPKLVSQLNGLLYLFERDMSVLPRTPSPT